MSHGIRPCSKKDQSLVHPHAVRKRGSSVSWPSFTGTANLVGTSPSGRVTVWVDASGPVQMQQNASDLLADADRIVAANDGFFGTNQGSVNVIVFALNGATDGTGGADHMGCDYQTGQNIEVDAAYGQSNRVSALFEAELSECAMNGQLCGYSTGEALSRWCAASVSNNALSDFASAPSWVQAGWPNWVDQTDPSDQNYPSIGCGMAFISWLLSQSFTLAEIAQAMVSLGDSGTFAALWQRLTSQSSSPWTTFLSAVKALPGGVTSDDPFSAGLPTPTPVPPPTGGVQAQFDAAFAVLENIETDQTWIQAEMLLNELIDVRIFQLTASSWRSSPTFAKVPWQQWLQILVAILQGILGGGGGLPIPLPGGKRGNRHRNPLADYRLKS